MVEVPRYGPPEVLRVADRPAPTPGPGEVAIRVSHAGVNFADVMTRRGDYHGAAGPPLVPGLEVTGTVEALGAGVTDLRAGQTVAAFTRSGGYAEVAVAAATLTFPLPERPVAPEVAAALPTIVPTALFLVDEVARVRPGESVLVHAAAGGVGTVLGQLARERGTGPVLGTVGSPDKADYARGFGYDEVFLREAFPAAVEARTDGRGVDVVFDSVGGPTRADSLETLAPLGRVVAFGNASGAAEVAPDGATLRSTNRGLLGFSMGSLSAMEPERVRRTAMRAVDLIADGTVRIHVTDVLDLSDAATAHERIESRATRGKLVLRVAAT